MPWFKVDDGLIGKSEILRIPRAHRIRAIGLWAFAGSWSAKELTDGHIPAHMLDELAATPEDAQWLVDVSIWSTVEDGWRFVEWAPEQPLREPTLARRAANTARVAGWRAKNVPRNSVTNTATNDAGNDETNGVVTPPPSLPIPTQPNPKNKNNVQGKPAHDYSDEFLAFWSVYPRRQAKPDAWKAYKAALNHTDAEAIFAGAQAYALLNIGNDKNFLKLPAGWLRDERWADEQIPPSPASKADQNASKYEQIYGVLEQGRRMQEYQDRPSPTQRATETLQIAAGHMCEIHRDYPMPCASCERDLQAAF